MLAKKKVTNQASLFFTLGDTLDQKHPLYILARKIDWGMLDREFSKLYHAENGRPAKPIRLMVGLLIIKHLRNISDESVVEQWSENNYYQYLCGNREFVAGAPCAASELVHFRHRIGEDGVELIFKESIRISSRVTRCERPQCERGHHRAGEEHHLPHGQQAAQEDHRQVSEDS